MSDLLPLAIGVTVVLQLGAAAAAVWLVRASGRRPAWALIAGALVVMALERAITFGRHLSAPGAAAHPAWLHLLALGGAGLILIGVIRAGRMLRGARRSEEALRVQQAFLGRLFESAPEAIVTVDNEGRLLRANTEFTRLFGYTVDEALGRSIDELIAPGEQHGEAAEITRRVAQGYTVTRETVRRRKDGTPVDVSIIGTPITIESGPVGVYGIYRDITERKRAEHALRRSEARLRLLVEQMPAILWTTDRDLRFTSSLGAGLHGLGLKPGEVVGRSLFEFFGTDDGTSLPIAMHRRALQGQPASYEVSWGGNVYQSHVQPLYDDAGTIAGCVGAALDITERRRLEAQLRQAQKMEAVGQLTGGIAHDFNNLLTVIMANAEIVTRGLPPGMTEVRDDIEDILAAARRGTALIKKLLGFSRRSQLELRRVDLGRLVADVSTMLPRLVPENIQIQLSGGETGVVEVDPNAVEQIVFNLVTNARDAMPDGGTLRIATGRRALPEAQVAQHARLSAGEYACLTVSDTGVGMNAATRERLFEPFFTTKPPGVGTGLGMAMIYGLVKQHNGYVEVESELDAGTTVRIYLPRSADPAVLPAVRAAPRTDGATGSATILVVEDEQAIRSAMKRALERHGYLVLVAADGEEALLTFQARQHEIDLVITDVIMPRMGGRDLYDAIRRVNSSVKVLFTSGYTARDLRDSTYLDPSVPFLPKPWTITELFERVRGILRKE